MSTPDRTDLARVLARKAEGDAKVARKLASDPDIDDEAVGFHGQQAIEKWLKAVMALHGLDEARILDTASANAPAASRLLAQLSGCAAFPPQCHKPDRLPAAAGGDQDPLSSPRRRISYAE